MGAFESSTLKSAPVETGEGLFASYEGPGPWYACNPDAEVQPRLAKRGPAGPDTVPTTMIAVLDKAAETKGSTPALLVERPCPPITDGKVPPALPIEEWTSWTYQAYRGEVRQAARGFIKLGMQRFESVNIWGFNAPEWNISCMAAMHAGGKCAGIYPTDTAETAAFKVVHSGGCVVVIEDEGKLNKLQKALSSRGDCKRLKAFVAYGFEPEEGRTVEVENLGSVPVLGWKALLASGHLLGEEELTVRISCIKPGHCAGLIYTSGTTGEPKAVMISHDTIYYEATTILKVLKDSANYCGTADSHERILSYLPLSHIAGFALDVVAPIVAQAYLEGTVKCYFARQYDLKEKTIRDRLLVAKPTVFLGVPLVWEKMADQIRSLGANITGIQKTIADTAKSLALQRAQNCQIGGDGATPIGYTLAKNMILSKISARLGLDECKVGISGAAPIRVDTLEYFSSLGLDIQEVYGMSECTGACTISTTQAHQWGSVGWEIPGVQVRAFIVDPTDLNKKTECPRAPSLDCTEEQYQGELCFRGRNVMMGYLANPDLGKDHVVEIEKKTAETIDADGWLHSGDQGMITKLGMVKITGRYKELIIGDGGENIAPVPIEDQVKKNCDGIAEVMMLGDKRKYNVALVTLKAEGANGEVPGTDQLDAGAKRVNPEVTKISEAMDNKVWIEAVTKAITLANSNGKCCPNNAFKIQKFTILPSNFSEESNELTPTKKLKRKIVENKFASVIEKMYTTEGSGYIRF